MDTTTLILLTGTALVSFFLSALLGKILIPVLHRLKFGQTIRDDGPAWHKSKQGTPTMGGLIFMLASAAALVAAVLVSQFFLPIKLFSDSWSDAAKTKLVAGVLLALCSGGIGFLDDYIKVVKKRNLGLTSIQKLLAQLLVGAGYAVSVYMSGGTAVDVPFIGLVDFGIWFIRLPCLWWWRAQRRQPHRRNRRAVRQRQPDCLPVFPHRQRTVYRAGPHGRRRGGRHRGLPAVESPSGQGVYGGYGVFVSRRRAGRAGLWNQPAHSARAGGTRLHAETLSVMLQVTYFKLTHGKRLFKMSPLHHHFEMCGWSENKIVVVFSVVTLLGCGLAALLMFL